MNDNLCGTLFNLFDDFLSVSLEFTLSSAGEQDSNAPTIPLFEHEARAGDVSESFAEKDSYLYCRNQT